MGKNKLSFAKIFLEEIQVIFFIKKISIYQNIIVI